MNIDLLLKFGLFHITASIKQDNRMLLALLEAKCRIMPAYYLEQPCKLSFNESYTGSNIHILNLTCSPDTREKKVTLSQFPKVITLSFCLCFSAFHPKTFDPFGYKQKRSVSGDHEKVRESFWMCLMTAPAGRTLWDPCWRKLMCWRDRWWLLGFVFCHRIPIVTIIIGRNCAAMTNTKEISLSASSLKKQGSICALYVVKYKISKLIFTVEL